MICPLIVLRVTEELQPVPADTGREAGPGRVTAFTHMFKLESPINFGMWEEAGDNAGRQEVNIQTTQDLNREPSCYAATVLTATLHVLLLVFLLLLSHLVQICDTNTV